jgi:hypothetical protein
MTMEALKEYVIVKYTKYIVSEWRVCGCKYLIVN